jgi:hypothetical protein
MALNFSCLSPIDYHCDEKTILKDVTNSLSHSINKAKSKQLAYLIRLRHLLRQLFGNTEFSESPLKFKQISNSSCEKQHSYTGAVFLSPICFCRVSYWADVGATKNASRPHPAVIAAQGGRTALAGQAGRAVPGPISQNGKAPIGNKNDTAISSAEELPKLSKPRALHYWRHYPIKR